MSPLERQLVRRVTRRAAQLTPELAALMLKAFTYIRENLTEAQMAKLIAAGSIDLLLGEGFSDAILDRAFLPLRDRLRKSMAEQIRYFARDLPKGGRIDGVLAISFDFLNPRVIDAVRTMETRGITWLKDDIRGAVRAYVEDGLVRGVHPRVTARHLRTTIGLAPNQAQAVANYRAMLESKDLTALTRKLRDRRFDATLAKALGKDGAGLSPEQIDRMVDAYGRRMVAFNANTHARTAALDSMRTGQQLSFQQGVESGMLDRGRLFKRWITVGDDRVRPEHVEMNGEVVPYDQPFSNGEDPPGSASFNCRCLAMHFQR